MEYVILGLTIYTTMVVTIVGIHLLITRDRPLNVGDNVELYEFDDVETVTESNSFSAYDCVKGRYGFWVITQHGKLIIISKYIR